MRRLVSALCLAAILMSGCDLDPLDEGTVLLTVSASSEVASPEFPVAFTVVAQNASQVRVVWGEGSSSCQLSLALLTPDGLRRQIDMRVCTLDLVEQALNPGESRTEIFEWGGEAFVEGQVLPMPPAVYRVVANAGEKGESEPVEVTLVRD